MGTIGIEEALLRQRPIFLILCNPKEEAKLGEADREERNMTSANPDLLSFEETKPSYPQLGLGLPGVKSLLLKSFFLSLKLAARLKSTGESSFLDAKPTSPFPYQFGLKNSTRQSIGY
ncbi:unnamed protein product [Cuscuta europaea]|uniref:Uncharacterized protein n=1 Tax=Cuscuta europaea TaxID=41803 RepID=A0A9P0YQZ0_CUSEU|nr:unnamed protein product [Cuscuta europaea]